MPAKARDHLQPGTPGLAAVDFDCVGDQHLADPAAARGHNDRVVLGASRRVMALHGEHADHIGAPLDLAIQTLDRVGRVQVRRWVRRKLI
jgi:hypothetical protein